MSSHARLAGSVGPAFLDRVFDLKMKASVSDLMADTFVTPTIRVIEKGIQNRPVLTRLGAPILAGFCGVSTVATAIVFLSECIFKGLANLLVGVYKFNKERVSFALTQAGMGVIGAGYVFVKGITCATIGIVGLVVAPHWTHRNIIAF